MGLGTQMIAWDEAFCEQLADRGYHVIRFDNRDIGQSTRLTAAGIPDIGALLAQALAGLPAAIATYAPDGAWPEGPAYWEYGTLYLVSALAALSSALGTDFGLSDAPGLSTTGRFRLHVTGPTGLFFNFSDASPRSGDSPMLFWLARRYDDPVLAVAAREAAMGRSSARDLLWYDGRGTATDLAALPLDARYQATSLAFFRSAWNDKDALYVAFKGGDNAANHSHLDLGTFVLDALGQRWAIDLGRDGYSLSGYFGRKRWTYYRLRTEGHNTLTFGGENQPVDAVAPIVAFQSSNDSGHAIVDLAAAYRGAGVTAARRGVALFDRRRRVMIQDEIAADAPVTPVWAMHTRAEVHAAVARATLSQGGATLAARILAPAGATFGVEPVDLAKPQKATDGVSKLVVHLLDPGTTRRIVVVFAPGAADAGTADVVPLDEWGRASSMQ